MAKFRWHWSRGHEETGAAEKRRRQRRKLSGRGLLVYHECRDPIPITIKELSDSGGRILLEEAHRLPEGMYLIDLGQGKAHEANLVWRGSG